MNPTLWIVVSAVGAAVIAAPVLYCRAAARRELELADELLEQEIERATSSGSS